MTRNKKTEHAGAKNGGEHWGPREEAKALSKKARRTNSKEVIENERQDLSTRVGSSPGYFKLNRKEMSQALKILDSQSSEINDYNLSYTYDCRRNSAQNKNCLTSSGCLIKLDFSEAREA